MDPFLRWNVPADRVLARWDGPGAEGVLAQGWWGALTLTVLGAPATAAALVTEAVTERRDVERITLPRGTLPLLDAGVAARVGDGADWDWLWTTDPPAAQPGEDQVTSLDDAAAVTALLDAASPRPDVVPGTPGVRAWLGVRTADRLVACGALTRRVAGAGHLASIATLPSSRGHGLGGAVTAALTRWSLTSGDHACTLGMYADNEPARRMYRRLGYRPGHEFSSRALKPQT